ncbi:methyltransferase [Georgenia sp. EYE_87]|uniref:class I SAM-dependent methyltransferase n=1 Tax=Georgenia sp. EYE_87 TaxID=2853448 RepID=UPI0020059E2F|nr:methyltransferase [Georgenia sp. EYE_87]MCK6212329.1 methyltransferase [Georgenia sp. EYE_87]
MSVPDHYFSAEPASPGELRPLTVRLRGREVTVQVAAGVFSGDRLDLGTRVLLDAVEDPPAAGTLVDVGCGWGPLTIAMAQASPGARVVAVDVNARARDLTARNARALGLDNVTVLPPEEVPALLPEGIDEIWSNPPIRIGKGPLHELLREWLGRLRPDGRAQLVVQRNLGADSLHRWLAEELGTDVVRTASAKGFRVLTVRPRG